MILSLVSQKGGSAKSTLAVSIAWELMARGAKVLLVDADPQQTVQDAAAVAARDGFPSPTVVAMGKDLYRPDQLPRLSAAFDHVVIDTPGRSGDVQNAALLVSDIGLVPVGQSAADMWAVSPTLDIVAKAGELKKMHGQKLKAFLVVTRRMPRTSLGKALRETLSEAPIPTLVSDTSFRVAWQECLGAGKGVAQYAPRDAAATELRALVDELLSLAAPAELEVANA